MGEKCDYGGAEVGGKVGDFGTVEEVRNGIFDLGVRERSGTE
jgi:hypothetical protein